MCDGVLNFFQERDNFQPKLKIECFVHVTAGWPGKKRILELCNRKYMYHVLTSASISAVVGSIWLYLVVSSSTTSNCCSLAATTMGVTPSYI